MARRITGEATSSPSPRSTDEDRAPMPRRIAPLVAVLLLLFTPGRAAAADPADPYMAVGVQLLSAGQVDKAIAAFHKAVQVSPRNPKAYNNLGYALEEKGLLDQALQAYVAALKIKPDYGDARDNLVHAACSKSRQLNDRGDHSEAETLLKRVIAQFPRAAEAHYFLGVTYKEWGKDADALRSWQQAATLRPDSGISWYVAASQKMGAGDFAGALDDLRKAIAKTPKNAYAHNAMGMALANTGQMAASLQAFQAAVKVQPGYANAWVNIGEVLSATGQPAKAMEAYQKATRANPRSAVAALKLAQACYNGGNMAQAEASAKKAVELRSDWAPARLQLGLLYARQKKYREAVAEFEAGVRADAHDVSCHYALGLIYAAAGEGPRAVKAFQEVIRINPQHQYAQDARLRLQVLATSTVSPSPSPPGTGAEPRAVSKPGLTLMLAPRWTETPLAPEDGEKYLLVARSSDGNTLWFYKPKSVPGGAGLKDVARYTAGEAKKMGFSQKEESEHPFGGHPGYRYLFAGGPADDFYLYVAVVKGKAYVLRAHGKVPADFEEFEKITGAAVLGN